MSGDTATEDETSAKSFTDDGPEGGDPLDDLTPATKDIARFLERKDDQFTTAEIADETGYAPSTVRSATSALDGVVPIESIPNPDDGRGKIYWIESSKESVLLDMDADLYISALDEETAVFTDGDEVWRIPISAIRDLVS